MNLHDIDVYGIVRHLSAVSWILYQMHCVHDCYNKFVLFPVRIQTVQCFDF